jgi:hypothetical protein
MMLIENQGKLKSKGIRNLPVAVKAESSRVSFVIAHVKNDPSDAVKASRRKPPDEMHDFGSGADDAKQRKPWPKEHKRTQLCFANPLGL